MQEPRPDQQTRRQRARAAPGKVPPPPVPGPRYLPHPAATRAHQHPTAPRAPSGSSATCPDTVIAPAALDETDTAAGPVAQHQSDQPAPVPACTTGPGGKPSAERQALQRPHSRPGDAANDPLQRPSKRSRTEEQLSRGSTEHSQPGAQQAHAAAQPAGMPTSQQQPADDLHAHAASVQRFAASTSVPVAALAVNAPAGAQAQPVTDQSPISVVIDYIGCQDDRAVANQLAAEFRTVRCLGRYVGNLAGDVETKQAKLRADLGLSRGYVGSIIAFLCEHGLIAPHPVS